jgi:hypothetical protein
MQVAFRARTYLNFSLLPALPPLPSTIQLATSIIPPLNVPSLIPKPFFKFVVTFRKLGKSVFNQCSVSDRDSIYPGTGPTGILLIRIQTIVVNE